MSSKRAKIAAAVASVGVLGAGWAAATLNGATVTSGSTSGSTSTYTDGTYTGTTVSHRYGSVAVTVTISGGRITDVTAAVTDDGQGKSQQINSSAIPTLKARVLAADSAAVSTVGGATYTTAAYVTSLQSALAQAGA